MSMDLELELELPAIRILPPRSPGVTYSSPDGGGVAGRGRWGGGGEGFDSDSLCLTPTSEEYKIPEVMSCPPAPRKPKPPPALAYKRKLASAGLRFFEIVARDEVEEFFRSFDPAAPGTDADRSMKRRHVPCK